MLTVLIVAVVISELWRGREVGLLWAETLMIALAHYFTSRRFIQLPPDVVRRLEQEGYLERESSPLYLPNFSIRLLIILAFAGLAFVLYRENRLFQPEALAILGTVLSYLIGVVAGAVVSWWLRGQRPKSIWWWDDLKAISVVLVLLVTATAFLADRPDLLPAWFHTLTLGLALFYFGSR